MNQLARAQRWHQTRPGLLIFGLAELAIAILLGLRAIDTGSLWQYFLALLLGAGTLQNFVRLVRTFISGPAGSAKKA
ncbi:MAG TPA: hypothetical protein VF466_03185 [Candidatus Saccharimonadales bacterium]